MTDRDKLIEILLGAENAAVDAGFFNSHKSRPKAAVCADHLLANGVIVLPCKVGDTVWLSDWWTAKGRKLHEPISRKVLHFAVFDDGVHVMCKDGCFPVATGIGKYAFFSREEAEAALRKEDEGK